MICKEEVIVWFRKLQSYERIDIMRNLLVLCLPFELRFLGTCLEELGRRDSQELRGMELRANNPQDLSTDMVACQKGEPTDKKIRRKMALYLALIRTCNRTCVTEIFRTLDGWGERDFTTMDDRDTLQELLLVYIMAANHPVFSFEQKTKCTQIYLKIKENKLVCDTPAMPEHCQHEPSVQPHQQHDLRQHLIPFHQELLQHQGMPQVIQLTGQPPLLQMPTQGTIPIGFPQAQHLPKYMTDASMQQMAVEHSMSHPIQANMIIPQDSNVLWRHYPQPGPTPEHPPQSPSPMLNQQPSHPNSRASSPNRNVSNNNIMQQRNMPRRVASSMKRRPSAETTPPPMVQMMSNDIMHDNMKNMDDVCINNENSSTSNLQNLIRNGYKTGQHARLKSANYIQQQQQSPVNQLFKGISPGSFAVSAAGVPYAMQNMSIADEACDVGATTSDGLDTCIPHSSSAQMSPSESPDTNATATNAGGLRMMNSEQPQQLSYNKQMMTTRLNGRADKLLTSSGSSSSSGSTSGYATTAALANAVQQSAAQQLFQTDMVLAPGGNAGTANLMQSAMANNNVNSVSSSSNNNLTTTMLMSTQSGGVITSNSGMPPQQAPLTHPQQYIPAYNYHTVTAAPAPQHHPSSVRPALMAHSGGLQPQTPYHVSTFLQTNGEPVLFPAYHHAGGIFLQSNAAPTVALHPAAVVGVSGSSSVAQAPQQQQPPSSHQPSQSQSSASYNKHTNAMSCYNCGSQTHTGHDCPEVSMDDMARNGVYKLDYTNTSPTVSALTGADGKPHIILDTSASVTVTSASSTLPSPPSTTAAVVATAINTK